MGRCLYGQLFSKSYGQDLGAKVQMQCLLSESRQTLSPYKNQKASTIHPKYTEKSKPSHSKMKNREIEEIVTKQDRNLAEETLSSEAVASVSIQGTWW